MGEREALVRALGEGAQAGRDGDVVTSCPYGPGDLLRSAWIRGYARTRALPGEDS